MMLCTTTVDRLNYHQLHVDRSVINGIGHRETTETLTFLDDWKFIAKASIIVFEEIMQ